MKQATKPRRRASRQAARRTAATTVEFAIVVPIIFAMFLGTVEITRLNFIRHSAANAAYEGARKSIVPGSTTQDGKNEALRLMNAVGVGNGVSVTVSNTDTAVTVSVNVPVNQNSWGVAKFSSGMNIAQSCTLSRESPR
ncbi:MAG: TadE/TadG family type IV pilus assembly protein [Aureliella sp.]|jgi:Flp pilus assembly protein TadG